MNVVDGKNAVALQFKSSDGGIFKLSGYFEYKEGENNNKTVFRADSPAFQNAGHHDGTTAPAGGFITGQFYTHACALFDCG